MRHWRFWGGLIISLVFLSLAARNIDFNQVGRALAAADYRFLLPAVAIYFVGVYIRSLRWMTLLSAIRPVPLSISFPIVVVGYMANNLLPARTGELVRAYMLSWRQGISMSASLATVAIERIFDGLTMIGFILVASLVIRLNEQVELLTRIASVLFVGLLAGLAMLALIRPLQELLITLLHRLLPERLASRVQSLLVAFVQGLGSLRSRSDLVRIVLTSVGAWLCEAGMYLIVAAAFSLPLDWPVALMTTAVANLFTLLPSSPGYVGIFEAGVLAVLVELMGLPRADALSYAIVLHIALWLPVTVLGLIFWSRASLSWSTLRRLPTDPDAGRVNKPDAVTM